jgi:ATP adenylyltransferase
MEYIINADKKDGCIFCDKLKEECSEENLVVFKGVHSFVIMNKFPYNSGHIMVMPYSHKDNIGDLSNDEKIDLMNNLALSIENLKKMMAPEGINVGLNMGRPAGAGVLGHLHFHIVPRWNGDTNFMTVFDDVRVVPEHLIKTYKKLYQIFNNTQGE